MEHGSMCVMTAAVLVTFWVNIRYEHNGVMLTSI